MSVISKYIVYKSKIYEQTEYLRNCGSIYIMEKIDFHLILVTI
jgi:hypothetical protein